jgi:hypothetical protein
VLPGSTTSNQPTITKVVEAQIRSPNGRSGLFWTDALKRECSQHRRTKLLDEESDIDVGHGLSIRHHVFAGRSA